MLLISAMLVGTSTYAWFSMNRTVTVTGMNVTAKAEKSLVISTSAPTAATVTRTVAMSPFATSLTPATHDEALVIDSAAGVLANSGLKKVNNPDIIDPATGFEYDGETATLGTATNGGETYYTDYVVYIASSGGDMTGMNLTAKLNVSDAIYAQLTDVSGNYDTWNAVSVDFYVSNKSNYTYEEESVSKPKGIYKGTLSLKNSTLAADAGAHSTTNGNAVTLLSNSTIPASDSTTDYLVVTMRVYFDGALEKTSGQAYIHTNAANTNGIAFTAIFDCATAS